jgi:tyrosyl-tRNA synthetase
MSFFEFLKKRGFIYQSTDDRNIAEILEGSAVFYAGFDPTADSLHIGHLLPIMLMRQMQRKGHIPIVLIGGATALIGDPSGKKEARPIISAEKVFENAEIIKKQLSKFIDPSGGKAVFLNNFDWLAEMKMIDYLRDLGSKFSVNKMLSAESVRQRLDEGISYLEFSYSILQAYDFLHLNDKYNCSIQIGGQDQWGNIVAGSDLVRRFKATQVYGITVPLLLSSSGEKFGKTAGAAVWLSPEKTPPFDYYQFWRNVPDSDCGRMLRLFTELPDGEIESLEKLQPPLINRAKEILAFECAKAVHGEKNASESFMAASSKFGSADPKNEIQTSSSIKNFSSANPQPALLPAAEISENPGEENIRVVRIFTESGLCSSNSEARRLIKGGGAYLNGEKISDAEMTIPAEKIRQNSTMISAGKKNPKRIVFKK